MDARSLHRAMTVESLRREGHIIPWPYDYRYGDIFATIDGMRDEVLHASRMYGAAMRGRLDQFLNEGEKQ